jgi:predicted double-glycine peptidase
MKLCELHRIQVDLKEICSLAGYSKETGTTMLGLYRAAQKLGMPVVPLRIAGDALATVREPSIAFVDGNHFLVFHRCDKGNVIVQDPPAAPYTQSIETFGKRWNGEMLVFSGKLEKQVGAMKTLPKPVEGPRIHFASTVHDFRKVDEGENVTYTFRFSNIGTEDLEVSARSTCTCSAAMVSGDVVPPGGSGEVKVTYDTNGRNGKTRQSVHVRSNDPSSKLQTLSIMADVVPGVKVIPDRIWLDELEPGQTVQRDVHLVGAPDRPFAITGIDAPEGITAKTAIGTREDGRIPVSLTIDAGKRLGHFSKEVVIHTDNPGRPDITIKVAGSVAGSLKANPPVFFFGDIASDVVVEKEVSLVSSCNIDIDRMSVRSNSPYVKPAIGNVANGAGLVVRARIACPSDAVVIKDTIALFTDNSSSPVLEIPLYAKTISER